MNTHGKSKNKDNDKSMNRDNKSKSIYNRSYMQYKVINKYKLKDLGISTELPIPLTIPNPKPIPSIPSIHKPS